MKIPEYEKPPIPTDYNIGKIIDDFLIQIANLIVEYEYDKNPLNLLALFSSKDGGDRLANPDVHQAGHFAQAILYYFLGREGTIVLAGMLSIRRLIELAIELVIIYKAGKGIRGDIGHTKEKRPVPELGEKVNNGLFSQIGETTRSGIVGGGGKSPEKRPIKEKRPVPELSEKVNNGLFSQIGKTTKSGIVGGGKESPEKRPVPKLSEKVNNGLFSQIGETTKSGIVGGGRESPEKNPIKEKGYDGSGGLGELIRGILCGQ